jgi:hypothetical protein
MYEIEVIVTTLTRTELNRGLRILGAEHAAAIERKSVDDLVACCGPEGERFERAARACLDGGRSARRLHFNSGQLEDINTICSC